jgi:phosphate-selective porin OprO/OprP
MRNSSLLAGAALGVMLASGIGAAAQAQDLGVKWKGAPELSNDDVKFKVRGRILLDAVFESVDNKTGTDYDARAIRGRQVFLGVEGQLNSQWAYKAEGGAVNGGAWAWDDVVIEYKPTENTSLMFGNIKVVSLENLTSTRFTSFMDRGPFADLTDASYTLGVVGRYFGPNYSATLGVQGASLNNADVTAPSTGQTDRKERIAVSGRLHWAPINGDVDKLHLAVWGRYRDAGSELIQYNVRPNTNYGDRVVDSGANYGDKDKTIGLEAAFIHGPFSVQGEWARISVDGNQSTLIGTTARRRDADFDTGYAFVSWFPTGETRPYDAVKGEFGRVKVLNPVTAGGMGAFELLARYDYADLSDARTGVNGAPVIGSTPISTSGKYTAWTAGVNYYPFPYVKFVANYTKGETDTPSTGTTADLDVFQMRAQLDF